MNQAPTVRRRSGPRKTSGFSLIEVLIALLIFALGMLGTLAMLLGGMKLTSSSTSRTIASEAAMSMAETLRANPGTVGSSSPATVTTFSDPTPAVSTTCMDTAGCDRNAYVNHAVQAWRNNLAASLPGGTGVVCRDSDPVAHDAKIRPTVAPPWDCDDTGQYIVKVCWNESRVAASTVSAAAKAAVNAQGSAEGGVICTWTQI